MPTYKKGELMERLLDHMDMSATATTGGCVLMLVSILGAALLLLRMGIRALGSADGRLKISLSLRKVCVEISRGAARTGTENVATMSEGSEGDGSPQPCGACFCR